MAFLSMQCFGYLIPFIKNKCIFGFEKTSRFSDRYLAYVITWAK